MDVHSEEVQLENYRGLVLQEAWKVWSQLPKQTRAWIGLEDVVETGMDFAWRTYTGRYGEHRRWNIAAKAGFGWYIKKHLKLHFMNQFVTPYYEAKQRCDRYTVSIDQKRAEAKERGDADGFWEQLFATAAPQFDCFIVDDMVQLYEAASKGLQEQIIVWFLRPERTKLHVSGKPFERAKHEFRFLADRFRITIDDCRHFMRSPVCLDQLSRKALWVPYDLDNPVPTRLPELPLDRQPWYRANDPSYRPVGLRKV